MATDRPIVSVLFLWSVYFLSARIHLLTYFVTVEPGPVIVYATPFNLSCISLSWAEPELPNGEVTNYQVWHVHLLLANICQSSSF